MKGNVLAHIALAIVAIIYGSNYIIAKDVMAKGFLDPFSFIMLRVLTASILFYLFHKIFVKEKVDKKDLLYLAMCGFFGVATNQLCFFQGLAHTSAIHASLIMTVVPILVLIFSWIVYRIKITRSKIIGIILGLSGAVLLIMQGSSETTKEATLYGDMFILANATSYSLYLVLAKKMVLKYNPITVTKWVFFFGMLMVIPFGFKGMITTDYSSMPANILWSIGFVLLFTTFFAYLLNAYALKKVDPSVVSFYIYFQPLIAALLAVTLKLDVIDSAKVMAAILLFSGVYLSSRSDKKINIV